MNYRQEYPYYFDLYDAYVSGGGIVTPAEVGDCPVAWGGFGRRFHGRSGRG
jgi:hypothetical protein